MTAGTSSIRMMVASTRMTAIMPTLKTYQTGLVSSRPCSAGLKGVNCHWRSRQYYWYPQFSHRPGR